MLTRLSIKNYALIEDIEMELGAGLTMLTGETGAGKSIILGAISLLAGNRADLSLVKSDTRKCIIEAEFNLKGLNMKPLFEELDLDYDEVAMIRREFSKDGRSRAFVNDTPAVLLQLRQIVNRLLDVHSQHENLELNSRKYQLSAIDAFAGNSAIVQAYNERFEAYEAARTKLEELKIKSARISENTDYMMHQHKELCEADLKPGELAELESEMDTLQHGEEIIQGLNTINNLLNGEEVGPQELLNQVAQVLRRIRSYMPDLEDYEKRMQSLLIELDDLKSELTAKAESAAFDPERMQLVQDRVSLLYQLQHKHRLSEESELIALRDRLEQELEEINNYDEILEAAERQFRECETALNDVASDLTASRTSEKAVFENEIIDRLIRLGMPKSSFVAEISGKAEYGPDGKDEIEFLFSANKGMPPRPIARVASGGELSRVMLSIKSALARKTALPTIIFDEVDAGISGEIADKMGKIIREMSTNTQVMAISHLPQVAAQGNRHFKVYKDDQGDFSETRITELTGDAQVHEIARLLSGEHITPEAISNAKVLLSSE